MLSGEPRVPVPTLRDAVRQAVQRTSSHTVAREVGMSAPSLRDFVAGSEPRPATVRKLTAWYIRQQEGAGRELDAETAAAALALLLEHIPVPRRGEVRAGFIDWLVSVSNDTGAVRPNWVDLLQVRI